VVGATAIYKIAVHHQMQKTIARLLERNAFLHSIVHRLANGSDTNRRVFVNLVGRGNVVIEVGANVGSYTLLLSRIVGTKGRVHAFEPIVKNYEKLLETVRREGRSNVLCVKKAVGQTPGNVDMKSPVRDLQQSSLVSHCHGSWADGNVLSESVQLTTIDEYARENELGRLDLLKVDTEGAELLVLKGARTTIEKYSPILHIEVDPNWLADFDFTTKDLVLFLGELGYQQCYAVDRSALHGCRKLSGAEVDQLVTQPKAGDYLFRR